MIDTIVEKAKGFLTDPVGTFQRSRTDEPGTVFTYFSVLLLVNAIFSAILAAAFIGTIPLFAGMKFGALLPVIVFFAVLVGGFIITLIFAAWVHLWVYIFGGRKGIMQTINAIIYGHTPRLLFGWIPFIGFIFTLWSLVLNIIGLRELQELSTLKVYPCHGHCCHHPAHAHHHRRRVLLHFVRDHDRASHPPRRCRPSCGKEEVSLFFVTLERVTPCDVLPLVRRAQGSGAKEDQKKDTILPPITDTVRVSESRGWKTGHFPVN